MTTPPAPGTPATPAARPAAPTGPVRLLAGWLATGASAGLADHLTRYGPLPVTRGLVDEVERAGLTGRGGGAFPTGTKMRAVAAAGRRAVVVVNGAESEPASAKDRLLIYAAPHLVLDGAVLAADALGAREVLIVVHGGQGLAAHLDGAVRDRVRAGLGRATIRVLEGPRRYVASQENALVHWLSGGPAQPTFSPPRPAQRGVQRRPSLVCNAETYAHLALIARYGADWFTSVGVPTAPGSLLVSIGGAVATSSVYEVPGGTRIDEALALAGGPSAPLSAVLVGGYFGSWLSAADAGTVALTPADLRAAGGSLGAGIILALDTGHCGLTESARVLRYLAEESAGQCGPCTFGLPTIADDFAAIATGRGGGPGLAARLERRFSLVAGRGACHHPDGAVQFAASAMRVFHDDLGRHLAGFPCTAARSAPLLPIPAAGERDSAWR